MKKITLGLLVFLSIQQLNAQGLMINGDLKNIPENTSISLIDGMGNKKVDSTKVNEGKFKLATTVENASIYLLSIGGVQQPIPMFVGNDKVSIVGDIQQPNSIEYTGSTTQGLYQSFMKAFNPKFELYGKTRMAMQMEKDAVKKDSLLEQEKKQSEDIIATYSVLVKENKQSPVSTFFLLQFSNIFPSVKENIAEYYALLEGDAKKGPFATFIEKTLQSAEIGKIGSVLPDFEQKDVNGKMVSLTSFRGKYVLVDFWASWCGPCRAENPNVVKTYHLFKDKGFTVLGVSLDQDKEKWLAAIKKDNLTWTHVSDLKYWNNAVAVKFGIQSIPASFLIDPNGKVIGRDLRGDDLQATLSKYIK